MAAPGRPKAWVAPSSSRILTAASAARIRGISVTPSVAWYGSVGLAAGQPLDTAEQARVVEPAVAVGAGRSHQLGDERTERDDHTGLTRGRGDDAEVLVVQ